jgi:hypothetical protein
MKMINAITIFVAAIFSLTLATPAFSNNLPYIAHWYKNYNGAVSLRFDDGLESHVNTVIPHLNHYGFKAIFLVNPGTDRYQKHRDFWEKQVPAMGHRLGNHTMHHHGASNLKEAEFEIGEAARMVRRVDPQLSKLLIFASGGGLARWGGKEWEHSDPAYRQLTKKHQLIDLYDGKHPALSLRANSATEDICSLFDKTAKENKYICLVFHHVGNASFFDKVKAIISGSDITLSEKKFLQIVQCLSNHSNSLWVAPLIDVLKYEKEVYGTKIKIIKVTPTNYSIILQVQTDPTLYDHKLTLVLPVKPGLAVKSVHQGNEECLVYQRNSTETLIDIKPLNSKITIKFNPV